MKTWIQDLQRHARSWWYAPMIGLLALLDNFLVVIPTDGLLVSAIMLHPRRWVYAFIMVAIGSSVGALGLAWAIKVHGLPLMLGIAPGLNETDIWHWTEDFMGEYGSLALFGVAASPLMQHPAITLAALTGMALPKIFFVVLLGRVIKYAIIGWVASHTPHLVRRFWGVRDELREVQQATQLGGALPPVQPLPSAQTQQGPNATPLPSPQTAQTNEAIQTVKAATAAVNAVPGKDKTNRRQSV